MATATRGRKVAVLTIAAIALAFVFGFVPGSEAAKGGKGKSKGQKSTQPLALSVKDLSKNENHDGEGRVFAFQIRLSRKAKEPVVVDYETVDGTAEAGTDYTSAAGSRTFKPGQKVKVVKVRVLGDTDVEDDETFTLEVSDADGALDPVSGTGTIRNDD